MAFSYHDEDDDMNMGTDDELDGENLDGEESGLDEEEDELNDGAEDEEEEFGGDDDDEDE